MLVTTKKIEERIGQIARVRTSINFNEYLRLGLLVVGSIIGVATTCR